MPFPKYINPVMKNLLKVNTEENNKFLQDKFYPETPRYKIINEIPRIVEDENNYCSAFGIQWNKWIKTQLDSYTGLSISRDRLLRCLTSKGIDFINNKKDVHILEVGCGAGRFTEIILEFENVSLTSLDLSNAVEANQKNCPQSSSHRIVQADIMNPPFDKEQFDIVICLGVIQHTPKPEDTIKKLFEQVNPSGILIFDHYTPNLRRYTKLTANFLRPFIKRLHAKLRTKLVNLLVDIFFPIHKFIRNIPFAQMLFSRISPIQTYFHCYKGLNDKLQKDWAYLDSHDALTDWYKHLRTRKELHNILDNLGAREINLNKGGNGIEAFCRKI